MSSRLLLPIVVAAICLTGCSLGPTHRHELDQHGYVFYCDGAGGGGVLGGWSGGVREGLKQAGYRGDFEVFPWHTGLGVAADQTSDLAYKRSKAADLAAGIRAYQDGHPGQPVNLVGLSAGTAIVVFTLEALPADHAVDNVVLLGSSLSSHHDMTEAMKRVRQRLVVFTSDRDAVLGALVPLAGTADREFCGACSAGLRGLHLPARAGDEAKRAYARIENVAWNPAFSRAGNFGGHTDGVNAAFVREYVAPRLMRAGPTFVEAGRQPVVGS